MSAIYCLKNCQSKSRLLAFCVCLRQFCGRSGSLFARESDQQPHLSLFFVAKRKRNRKGLSDAIDHLSGSNKWGLKNSIKIINACYFSSAIFLVPQYERQKPCLTQIQLSFYYLPGLYPITLGHFIDKNKAV